MSEKKSPLSALSHTYPPQSPIESNFDQLENVIVAADQPIAHVLVREAIQNTFDARAIGEVPEIEFRLRNFNRVQKLVLKEKIFGDDFQGIRGLESFLGETQARALIISDRGTTGLSGETNPMKAQRDYITKKVTSKFYRFVWPAQRNPDFESMDGGAFGIGRNVYFRMSKVRTIVVFSRTLGSSGEIVSRLIACGRSDPFALGTRFFQGVHFWADPSTEWPTPTPIEGEMAERLAKEIDIDGFLGEELGTAIMILDPGISDLLPETENVSPTEIEELFISEISMSAQIWAWPHIVDETMNFHFAVDHDQVIATEDTLPDSLKGYVEAYRRIDSELADLVSFPNSSNTNAPKIEIARLAGVKRPTQREWQDAIVPKQSVALMRSAKLIVKYFQIPEVEGAPFNAVFKVTDLGADHVFRASEPAAHDEWKEGKQGDTFPQVKGLVHKTNSKLRSFLRDNLRAEIAPDLVEGSRTSHRLADISFQFGRLFLPLEKYGVGLDLGLDEDQESSEAENETVSRVSRIRHKGSERSRLEPFDVVTLRSEDGREFPAALFRTPEGNPRNVVRVVLKAASRESDGGNEDESLDDVLIGVVQFQQVTDVLERTSIEVKPITPNHEWETTIAKLDQGPILAVLFSSGFEKGTVCKLVIEKAARPVN